MDALADELGPDVDVGGVAVAYRDAANVGPSSLGWRPPLAYRVASRRSRRISRRRAMTWLAEFDDLLICEVVPGHQAFS